MKRLVFLVMLLVFLPNPGRSGSYNSYSNLAYCEDRLVCLHELAHAMDHDANWISQTPEFEWAVGLYLQTAPYDTLYLQIVHTLATTKQNQAKEVYAWFFAYADGNVDYIPRVLQPYYDQKTATIYSYQIDRGVMWLGSPKNAKWFAEFTQPIMKR